MGYGNGFAPLDATESRSLAWWSEPNEHEGVAAWARAGEEAAGPCFFHYAQ